jgi:adenine-specific DNA-methyltransferase
MPTLQFKGKPLVQNHHLVVPFSELDAVKSRGLSKSPSLHDNLIIEGDNLKALKALLPTYHGKIKCIYIDPPYNTGNEGWIYNDKVNSPMIRDWLGKTVDRDDLTRHDKWCCMMLPRLKLLRELLTDDGAIFVSIDDNEVHHLRALMNEVFGENNFLATVGWQKVFAPKPAAKTFSTSIEPIVVYAREFDKWDRHLLPRTKEQDERYSNPDNDSRGPWASDNLLRNEHRDNSVYTIVSPSGKEWTPKPGTSWRHPEPEMLDLIANGEVWFGEKGDNMPRRKKFLADVQKGRVPETLWPYWQVGHTQDATREVTMILGASKKSFQFPKPTLLVRRIIQIATGFDDLVLDPTAGSATTAQAVLALNKEDGGNRRFILCQMPYETKDQEKSKQNICETITAERVRRVIKGVPKARDENLRNGLGGTFSYFKLGKELRKQAILDGKDLPSYEALAGYVFFTATGEEFQPKKMKAPFIGTSGDRDVFLVYEENLEKLKDMALNLDLAREIAKRSDRKKLIFAPTKYLDQEYLERLKIEFCQLPFEIYQRATNK